MLEAGGVDTSQRFSHPPSPESPISCYFAPRCPLCCGSYLSQWYGLELDEEAVGRASAVDDHQHLANTAAISQDRDISRGSGAEFYPQRVLCVCVVRSQDEDISLVSEEEFYRDAPEEISQPVSPRVSSGGWPITDSRQTLVGSGRQF